MIEINQVFYSIFAFFALGLGLNSYIGFKDQHTYLKTEVYWSISVYLFIYAFLFFMGGCACRWSLFSHIR
jgi:hypothetical protein